MNVTELIEKLKKCNPEFEIFTEASECFPADEVIEEKGTDYGTVLIR